MALLERQEFTINVTCTLLYCRWLADFELTGLTSDLGIELFLLDWSDSGLLCFKLLLKEFVAGANCLTNVFA
jgi:hypothetical protein